MQITDRVCEDAPSLVVVSLLGREGLTFGHYLLRRLRARFADMPIVAARWGQTDDSAPDAARLIAIGASSIALSLADACTQVMSLNKEAKAQKAKLMASPLSA